MIENNNSLKTLIIENMNIQYSGVLKLKAACEIKHPPLELIVNGNFV